MVWTTVQAFLLELVTILFFWFWMLFYSMSMAPLISFSRAIFRILYFFSWA